MNVHFGLIPTCAICWLQQQVSGSPPDSRIQRSSTRIVYPKGMLPSSFFCIPNPMRTSGLGLIRSFLSPQSRALMREWFPSVTCLCGYTHTHTRGLVRPQVMSVRGESNSLCLTVQTICLIVYASRALRLIINKM